MLWVRFINMLCPEMQHLVLKARTNSRVLGSFQPGTNAWVWVLLYEMNINVWAKMSIYMKKYRIAGFT